MLGNTVGKIQYFLMEKKNAFKIKNRKELPYYGFKDLQNSL